MPLPVTRQALSRHEHSPTIRTRQITLTPPSERTLSRKPSIRLGGKLVHASRSSSNSECCDGGVDSRSIACDGACWTGTGWLRDSGNRSRRRSSSRHSADRVGGTRPERVWWRSRPDLVQFLDFGRRIASRCPWETEACSEYDDSSCHANDSGESRGAKRDAHHHFRRRRREPVHTFASCGADNLGPLNGNVPNSRARRRRSQQWDFRRSVVAA